MCEIAIICSNRNQFNEVLDIARHRGIITRVDPVDYLTPDRTICIFEDGSWIASNNTLNAKKVYTYLMFLDSLSKILNKNFLIVFEAYDRHHDVFKGHLVLENIKYPNHDIVKKQVEEINKTTFTNFIILNIIELTDIQLKEFTK
jgi:hypothetical protein